MKKLLSIFFLLFLLVCPSLYAGEYLGDFQIGDTVYFSAAFNDTTGTQYENTASVAGRLYRGGTYVAAPAWAELDDANLVGVWQTSQDTTGYTAGQYTMVVWGTIDSSKVPQTTLTFNLYAATGKQVDIEALGGVAQSLTDLKDFADAGFDPTSNGVLLQDGTGTGQIDLDTGTVLLRSATETQIDNIEGDTDELQTNQGNWLTATGFSTHSAADIWSVGTRALTDKAGFSLSAAGIDSIWDEVITGHSTSDSFGKVFDDQIDGLRAYGDINWLTATGFSTHSAADAADAVWDEILTGASHNDATSAGRRLRQATDVLISREGTCQVGGANNEVVLDTGASAVNDFYLHDIVILTSGTGAGESRHIDSYVGATQTATVNRSWTTNPDATTNYTIRFDSAKHVHGFEAEAKSEINAEVDNALNTVIPAAPTDGSINSQIKRLSR